MLFHAPSWFDFKYPPSWKRRLETAAVAHYIFIWIIVPIFSLWLPFYILFFTPYWWTMIAYAIFTYVDRDCPRLGSRCWTFYKYNRIWKYFADYFPIRIVKTADLPPNRNYIIGSHPHGALAISAFTNMLTGGTGFEKKFPGLKSTVLTLNGQFYFPFRRDIGIALGGVESSKESLEYLLENPGKGRAVSIVIGGATEALEAQPGSHRLNILKRRGFCKYALKYGTDLVPNYNFGENDAFEICGSEPDSNVRKIQRMIKDKIGFCPPLFVGRGLFSPSFGLLPHRRPITSVFGKPIRVKKVANPTEKQVDDLHSKYCNELYSLFEKHKHLHKIPPNVHLDFF